MPTTKKTKRDSFNRLKRHLLWWTGGNPKRSLYALKRCGSRSPDVYGDRCVKALGHQGWHSVYPQHKGAIR